jgi:hypothetical protein
MRAIANNGMRYSRKQEFTMRIWKWTLEVTDLQTILMPEGAHVLSVQTQDDVPQLWALVDETMPTEPHTFATYSTGHRLPYRTDYGRFIGTYQIKGMLVFHVFEQA